MKHRKREQKPKRFVRGQSREFVLNQHVDIMLDSRTKRQRSRSEQKRRAILENM